MSKEKKPYSYFDTPDGEDIDKKLWCVVKPTAKAATLFSICDVFLYSHPKGYLQTLGRMAVVITPIVGVAATIVLTTNLVGSVRKKDDITNWAIGGAVGGALVGAVFRKPFVGFNCAVGFGILAAIRKDMQKNYGETVVKPYVMNHCNPWSVRHDWSLLKDPPKRWTTGE